VPRRKLPLDEKTKTRISERITEEGLAREAVYEWLKIDEEIREQNPDRFPEPPLPGERPSRKQANQTMKKKKKHQRRLTN
jgi:hypothetical protein